MQLIKNVTILKEGITYDGNQLSLEAIASSFDRQQTIPLVIEGGVTAPGVVNLHSIIGGVEQLRVNESNELVGDLKMYGNPAFWQPLLARGVEFKPAGTGVVENTSISDFQLLAISVISKLTEKKQNANSELNHNEASNS